MATLDEARAQFEEFARRMGYSAEESARGLAQLHVSLSQSSSRASAFAQALNSAAAGTRQQGAAAASVAAEMKRAAQQAKASGASSEEVRRDMEKLANSINANIDDPRMRASIQRYATAQVNAAERAEMYQKVMAGLSGPAQTFGNVLSSYQAGSSQISTSSVLLKGAVGGVGGAFSTFGKALEEGGAAVSLFHRGYGLAMIGAGFIVDVFGKTLTAVAEKALPFLEAELNKNINAFQSMSGVGAIFADGLTQMVEVAGNAHLALDQLAKIAVANKDALASLGEGVSGGLTRLSNVMATGSDNFRKHLLNLGYSVEEQAGLIAETMRDMRQSGSKLPKDKVTEELIATQTQRYAENLRILADISGEDAKSKMAAARQAAAQLAFQQEINKLSPEMRKAAQDQMANMTQAEKQLFMEKFVNNGQALTQGSAVLASQVPGISDSMDEMIASVRNGTASLDSAMQIQARYQSQINDQIQGLDTAIGLSGLMGLQGPAAALSQTLSGLNGVLMENSRRTQESYDQARDAATRQSRPEDQRGANSAQEAMTAMINANQELNASISKATNSLGALDTYASWAAKAANLLAEGIDSLMHTNLLGSLPNSRQNQERLDLAREEAARLERQRDETRANPPPNSYPPGQGPGQPGFVPQPGDIVGGQLDRLLRNGQPVPVRPVAPLQPNATAPAGTPLASLPATPPANMTPEQRREWERTHPGQQIPPSTPAGATRAATPDMNSNEGQRAAAENFYNGRATALPNGPTPNETPEQRQAREQTPATTGNNGRQPRTVEEIRQERREDATAAAAPVVAEVQRLAALMTDVNRHLESIDRNINGVNSNTGALVHLQ